jgi:hypothetical protein
MSEEHPRPICRSAPARTNWLSPGPTLSRRGTPPVCPPQCGDVGPALDLGTPSMKGIEPMSEFRAVGVTRPGSSTWLDPRRVERPRSARDVACSPQARGARHANELGGGRNEWGGNECGRCDRQRLFSDALATVLTGRGWNVVSVEADPARAVAAVSSEHVDVCMMELSFPEGNTGIVGDRGGARRISGYQGRGTDRKQRSATDRPGHGSRR